MATSTAAHRCSECGTDLRAEPEVEGLCPTCLLVLALDTPTWADESGASTGAPTLQYSGSTFEEGQIQGERYRVRSLLGRGGMGEVWRAYDLKLRQDVALKALRTELIEDSGALETLRQEVRTAREVISPNVCRVFDLQELDGRELVSMEYIDGTTLQEILEKRSPLELDEAREIASQFLAGLEAIHDAGLVHRDIKPENVMVTRTGRVVVMDFGIAKGLSDGKGGLIAGTPAYMSPEQARGEALDARSDVFSTGVVLAEMVAPGGVRSFSDRQQIWDAIRRETTESEETPWSKLIYRCVEANPAERFASAAELARALEEVTLRAVGDDAAHPYPGLSAFQQEDARFFFGRELEVEALWKKLRRPHLLALIGPSGAGKSSFLRAGLLPTLTDSWQAIVTTPGDRPFGHIARALVNELGDAPGVTDLLQHIDEPEFAVELLSEWRKRSRHGLLIVDQFEELFTQTPEETQRAFADLLGRLPLEADLFVLLAMRDDFLFHCQAFESLAPVFSEMTPLGPPTGASLRRAIVEPALKCGYRFEDEAIIEEMLSEVEGRRGALPLLAFAAAQLWERRNRETGLLSRKSYEQIGGVGGALAQHAEAILDYIGEDNIPIVRELFRNLVTAQGTRASRNREELLSVFPEGEGEPFLEPSKLRPTPVPKPQRPAAKHVLNSLIDARLLTSYEIPADQEGKPPLQRIEIVHESLLKAWPRLVRWQRQDADSAQMRDELRSQARLWDEHGRSEDYLWTGTAFKEYALWRENYPGGLSDTEEAFGQAMTRHAERRQRQKRLALGTLLAVLLAVLVVVTWSRFEAKAEARRAEAANLFALAQLELADRPTATVAYAIASLERADDSKMRQLALEALWRGPTQFRHASESSYWLDFSRDGRWLLTGNSEGVQLWPADGGPARVLEQSEGAMEARFSTGGNVIGSTLGSERQALGLWSYPDGRPLTTLQLGDLGLTQYFWISPDERRLISSTEIPDQESSVYEMRSYSVPGGESELLARLPIPPSSRVLLPAIDPQGSRLAWPDGRSVRIARLTETGIDQRAVISLNHERAVSNVLFDEQGTQLATVEESGTIRIWSSQADTLKLRRTLAGEGKAQYRFSPSGALLANSFGSLWDLSAPSDAEPLHLSAGGGYGVAFDPKGRWLGIGVGDRIRLWPLSRAYPQILKGHEDAVSNAVFTPDGQGMVSTSEDGSVRLWPLGSKTSQRSRVLYQAEGLWAAPGKLVMSQDGSLVVTSSAIGQMVVIPLDGSLPRLLTGFTDVITGVSVGPQARLVAASAGVYIPEERIVRLWDLETGEVEVFQDDNGEGLRVLEFAEDGSLWVHSGSGLRRLEVEGGQPHSLEEINLSDLEAEGGSVCDLDLGGRRALICVEPDRLLVREFDSSKLIDLGPHYGPSAWAQFDDSGEYVFAGDPWGVIQISSVHGGAPHLLIGHEGWAVARSVSPDGRWIASGGVDKTIRLWPMPDLSRTPLNGLPLHDLLAKLRSLTNLRVVEDPESQSGWKLVEEPFAGWEGVPAW